MFAGIGACIDAMHTTIVCTGVHVGPGVDTDVSVFICIGAAPCTVTTKDIGVECALTGTCGSADTTTSLDDGSGADTGALVTTCIACEF